MSSELKPCCPFCRAPLSRKYHEEGGWMVAVKMRCENDACPVKPEGKWHNIKDSPYHKNQGKWESREDTEAKAAADWNRRAPSPAVKALVEAFGPLLDLIPRDGAKPEAVRKAQAALAAVEREIGGA